MRKAALHFFPDDVGPATRLADALGVGSLKVAHHSFPDGESLVRVEPRVPAVCLLYRSLNDPNAKLIEVLFAASALRANGASRVVLVAPYLGYMRQDIAFRPGEAVSQGVVGGLIAGAFDACVTVDVHLHRVRDFGRVLPGITALNLSAAEALSSALDCGDDPVIVGPDDEATQWVSAIALPHRLDVLVGRKDRRGDRQVAIEFDGTERVRDRNVVLVDDMIASGTTLKVAAGQLLAAGARRIEVLATHCLAGEGDLNALKEAGIERIQSSDSVPGPTATIELAGILAVGIEQADLLA